MKRILAKPRLSLLLGLFFVASSETLFAKSACAQEAERAPSISKDTGVGFILGEPTGVTAKIWTGPRQAVDVGLAFSFNQFYTFYADYLFHFPELFSKADMGGNELHPYVGVGLMSAFGFSTMPPNHSFSAYTSSFGLGIRVPFGLEWLLAKLPLGLFIEFVPGLGVSPNAFAYFGGGVGMRYYF